MAITCTDIIIVKAQFSMPAARRPKFETRFASRPGDRYKRDRHYQQNRYHRHRRQFGGSQLEAQLAAGETARCLV